MTDPELKSRNLALKIGLSIPVAMVLFVFLAINGPRWFTRVEPAQFDFLYMTGTPEPELQYVVRDGKLTTVDTEYETTRYPGQNYGVRFFVHDVSENKSAELSFEEASQLSLDSRVESPDGYTIQPGRRGAFFIFDYRSDYSTRYLVKDRHSKKLNLETASKANRYYWNIHFHGWIIDE